MSKAPAVNFTHVDRVVFPEAGITKGDILQYYQKVSSLLLPHLRDRPLTLQRLPDGFGEGKQNFWQKNSPSYYPKWIKRFNMPTEEGKPVDYAIVNDLASLLYLVNQNTITFHTFLSRIKDLEHPDYVLFDLDPGPLSFKELIRIAKQLRKILVARKVKSLVKTSGKSGLHVLTPPPKNRALTKMPARGQFRFPKNLSTPFPIWRRLSGVSLPAEKGRTSTSCKTGWANTSSRRTSSA